MSKKCEFKDGGWFPCKTAKEVNDILKLGMRWGDSLGDRYRELGITHCPFCGFELDLPPKIKVGMFGKFYDKEDPEHPVWGILTHIAEDMPYPYESADDSWGKFEPGLPQGFNEDGTPL